MQYRTIHGYRRAFRCEGQGPPLLLIHGIGDRSDTWNDIIPILAQRHTVIAPDLLGHGRSDKPRADYSIAGFANAMRDLLSVLDVEKVTVVGHSLGGGVAMQFAYQYPERCERLVLVATGGVTRDVNPALRLVSATGGDLFLPLLRYSITRKAGRVLFRLLERLDTDLGVDAEDLFRVFEALPDATARQAFVRTLRAVVDGRGQVVTFLDRCYLTQGMPTLLVWGDRDAVIPVHHAQLAFRAMPGCRLEVFEGAGHFPHRTHPERFVRLLYDFLDSTEPASYSSEQWRTLLSGGRAGLTAREVTATHVAA